MSDHIPSLADLRRDIDVLDDQIQDLLRRRAEAVQRVADSKEASGETGEFLRPGREAQTLRRVLERHNSSLPPAALLRIWRELIAALYRLQAPVTRSEEHTSDLQSLLRRSSHDFCWNKTVESTPQYI